MKKYIHDRLANGSFKPEIARTFPFDQTDSFRHLEHISCSNGCGLAEARRNIASALNDISVTSNGLPFAWPEESPA